MPRTALIVEVPEAEPLVYEWRLKYDNASLGVPAHITILFPFVAVEHLDENLSAELGRLFAKQPAFSFALRRVERFQEHAWLTPEPSKPFRRLTELVWERYPSYPPYAGAHDEIIPHLTVAQGDIATQDEVEAAVAPQLPIQAQAREVTLLVEDESARWRPWSRLPLA